MQGEPAEPYNQYCDAVARKCIEQNHGTTNELVYDELEDRVEAAACDVFPARPPRALNNNAIKQWADWKRTT